MMPSPETVALLEAAARGEISTAELIRKLYERYSRTDAVPQEMPEFENDRKLAQDFMKKRRKVFRKLATL